MLDALSPGRNARLEEPGQRGVARDIMWATRERPGLEHLYLITTDTGIVADGLIVGLAAGQPFRLRYTVRCDSAWRVREVEAGPPTADPRVLRLHADGCGRWTDDRGVHVPALDACRDVDIAATPFTNTLPIRRLDLRPGHSAELTVAYVRVPDLSVEPVRQRYTCLERSGEGARYRYEGLETGFTADLSTDPDGLVLDYPGIWHRVWSD